MDKDQDKSKDDSVEFKYEGGPPSKDFLNYKNMDIEMSLWARTDTGWMSVLVVLGYVFLCVGLMTLLYFIRFGHL